MPGFVLLEHDFARLTPEFQRELLQLFGIDGRGVEIKERETEGPARPGNPQWDANDGSPYPLSLGEAKDLVRGLSESSRNMLRCFCRTSDTPVGSASLTELMRASGHSDAENLRKAIPGITRRLRNVAAHPQAWIFDWRDADWEWDGAKKTWARGAYHIPQPAISVLCQAFGAEAVGK